MREIQRDVSSHGHETTPSKKIHGSWMPTSGSTGFLQDMKFQKKSTSKSIKIESKNQFI